MAAGFSLGTLLGRPTWVVRWTSLVAAVIGVIATDGVDLRLDLGQLIDQRFGIGRHIVVQAIVLVLHANGSIVHEEAAHLEWGHAHIGTLDLSRAAIRILEARERWDLGVHLLDPFVERLDLDLRITLDVHVDVEALPLGSIFVAHGQEMEALAIDERVPSLTMFLGCWRRDGE